jgi:hypothetical protein
VRIIKSRRVTWAGILARVGNKNTCKLIVGKPERKRPIGRPRHRRLDSFNTDFKETWCEDVYWIQLAQDKIQWWEVVNTKLIFGFRKVREIC